MRIFTRQKPSSSYAGRKILILKNYKISLFIVWNTVISDASI